MKVRLGDVCEILDSKRIPITASQRAKGIYPYYGANGIQDYVDGYIFDDELVLLAEDGGNFGSNTKPIAYRVSGKCWVNNHAHVLKPKDNINVDFLCYSLMFYDVSKLVNGATRQKLTQSDMRKIMIALPSKNEQNRIVAQLNKIDKLIDLRKRQLEKLDVLVKSQFIEMFGDMLRNSKYPTIELGKISEMVSGGTPSSKKPEFFGGNIPFISTPCLGPNFIDASVAQNWLTEAGVSNSSTHVIPAYSLLIGNRVGVGKSSINTCEMCTNQDILSFVGIDTEFYDLLVIKKVLEQYEPIFESQKRGATIKGIPSDLVKVSRIPQAPIGVQRQFSMFVKQVDKSESMIKRSLEKLETLKKALMQKYFG